MKSKDIKILREKDSNELQKQVTELRAKLTTLMPQMYAGKESNLKQGWKIRRDIAQILTIIHEASLIINEPKKEETV